VSQQPITDDLAWFLDESGWTDANKRNATSVLNRWHAWLTAHDTALLAATGRQCREWIAERGTQVAPATNRLDWRFLRAFYEWAACPADEGGAQLIDRSPMLGVKAPRVPEGARQPTATLDDFETLIRACGSTREPQRNRAMIGLMFRSGLRVSEVLALNLDELHLDGTTSVPVPHVYIAKPKNGKPRNVPLTPDVVLHLRRHLRVRVGAVEGPLFTGTARTDDADGRLGYQAVRSMLRRVGKVAGIDIATHAFRRGMATDYLARGGQQVNLQRICGWTDGRMVARYANARLDEIAAAEFLSMHSSEFAVAERRAQRRKARKARERDQMLQSANHVATL
jgi:integrase